MKGDAANKYINHEFAKYPGNIEAYELSDKIANSEKIMEFFSNEMKGRTPATSKLDPVALAIENRATGSDAVEYRFYLGTPLHNDLDVTENCSAVTLKALKYGSSSLLPYTSTPIPQNVDVELWVFIKGQQ